jgi:transposase
MINNSRSWLPARTQLRGTPVCQTASRQVHCYSTRTLTDLGWADFQVQMKLHVRRFVCSNAMCPRRTFAERLGEPIKAYARRTKRCAARLQTIGLMLGGNAGALLAKRMGLPVSADTLLRLVRALEVPERATPEMLGIDDCALRKGQKYGTILVDVENHCLVDLLPDREKATVMAWMKAHAGVKVVSRDRGVTYADVQMEAVLCRFRKECLPLLAPFAIEMALSLPNPEGRTCRHSEKGSRYLPR